MTSRKQQGTKPESKPQQQSQSGKTPSNTVHTHQGQGTGAVTPGSRPGAKKAGGLNEENNELAKSAAGHRSRKPGQN